MENAYWYKIKIIDRMIEGSEESGFGAHLSMEWWSNIPPINLDTGALKVLRKYYEEKGERGE